MFHIQGLAGEVDFREGRFWLQRAAAQLAQAMAMAFRPK
jgi:hypothetical protein